jgi:hypothetical protein
MSLLVVGSVAFDAVETPFGKRDKMLGGSAAHFSISASFFTNVRVVGVVGGDFSREEEEVFNRHGGIRPTSNESPRAKHFSGEAATITTLTRRTRSTRN